MPETTLNGVNAITYPVIATWHWEVAAYLFLGGLVAGLMVVASAMHLLKLQKFARALQIGDLTALPLLAVGMFLLWLDLANRWNVWRFYTTIQWTSVMSWGSWILLLAMIALTLRLVLCIPNLPAPRRTLRTDKITQFAQGVYGAFWHLGSRAAQKVGRIEKPLSAVTLLLGIGVGIYTGMLLSTIAARPLWNSAVLPFLFLTSGVASGAAFMMLFAHEEEQARLLPFSIALGFVELVLLAAYIANLMVGSRAMQRATALLFSGGYALIFWGVVVLIGVLIPIALDVFEWRRERLPGTTAQTPPLLKLAGGAALRFVVVYAGLASFI